MAVLSPLTQSPDVSPVRSLNVRTIEQRYRDQFGMDVSRFFAGLDKVMIYRCNQSKLKFYYPFTLAGDADFYADLGKHYTGYYSPWKWEHEQVFQRIKPGDKVLEIGSGNGYFLKKLPEKGAVGLGLELNDDAIAYGKKLGVEIINQDLKIHAEQQADQYDVVCAFQVFEHVNQVGDFFRQAAQCVKPGGLLAVGVPNNASYYFREDPYHTLNLPPHHTLLWEPVSLQYAGSFVGLQSPDIRVETASVLHRSAAYRLWLEKNMGQSSFTSLLYKATRFVAKRLPLPIDGATVVAIYRK
ncbi:class I SAM-dependent methyltransferase [Larkinella terrae]|uniref:Methyltransferase domain-containing protein n=1 Tax=Larkinella terrae TaxID=2025311 RepID=A0A7K0ED55_9BACT|nr:class I SAM-dependent methyltransferase [Larkinella terrae]MRS59827.1 methyltransferase domain-containing protein [Larkinella terrae]